MKKLLLSLALMLFSTGINAKTIELNKNNTLVMNKEFDMESVSKVLSSAFELSVKNPNTDLYLVLDSPGGSVMAGMNLLEGLKALPNKIHTITFYSASMGYQTVQNLGQRYITSYGVLMSHRAKLGGLGGQIPGELDVRLKFYKDLIKQLDVTTSKRVGLSLEDYSKLIHDEFWAIGNDAVEMGHADEVVNVKCSDELSKSTHFELYNTLFGSYDIEWSMCPVIRFPVGIKPADRKSYKGLSKVIDTFRNLRHEKGL